jgi:hypothetical protein
MEPSVAGSTITAKAAIARRSEAKELRTMSHNQTGAGLAVIGRLPEGYIILCKHNGEEYSFLVKTLGISVKCPHCGATRCGPELAAESYLGTTTMDDRGLSVRPRARIERLAAE